MRRAAPLRGRRRLRPRGTLIADSKGVLYGTTHFGAANGAGTVFKLLGAGFKPTAP